MSEITNKPTETPEVIELGRIDDAKVAELIEEFESEAQNRQLSGVWKSVAAMLGVAIAVYALYWTQHSVTTQIYRGSFLLLVLLMSFVAFPMLQRGRKDWMAWLLDAGMVALTALTVTSLSGFSTGTLLSSPLNIALLLLMLGVALLFVFYPVFTRDPRSVTIIDYALMAVSALALVFLILNFADAQQRIVNPTNVEIVLGFLLIIMCLEATRRTTGNSLPLITLGFFLYALFGNLIEGYFGHRGYRLDRIIGQNYLTLEGLFGVPLDVAATFIVLFTIYGAVLEYSGAGKFFLDWAFAALGKSNNGSGPGRTVTAAGFLLGTVSGSGVATTVTLGALAWPMLKKAGYNKEVAGGILSAAGIGATLSPPTLGAAAFIIAEYLGISYLSVLIMAMIPTILYYLSCFFMIEADSRRMKTHAVIAQTESLKTLTLKYGYHFSSLLAVALLMATGMSAFLAVFWSIMLAYVLSFVRPENRLHSLRGLLAGVLFALALWLLWEPINMIIPDALNNIELRRDAISRAGQAVFWGMLVAAVLSIIDSKRAKLGWSAAPIMRAFESGGKGTVSIAATTAIAGVIVSIITLTGLGTRLSGGIVQLAGNSVLLTVIFAALAIWVLGLAVPVTASYIIGAVMIVPALKKVGVPEPAAHMFLFYYAVLADVTPPTALAPAAAAALTGGKPYPTMMMAWKYCLPAFLVPFMFTIAPEGASLLMVDTAGKIALSYNPDLGWLFDWSMLPAILQSLVTACIGVWAFSVALGAWLRGEANVIERILAAIAGVLLLFANTATDLAGLALMAVVVAMHVLRLRRVATIA